MISERESREEDYRRRHGGMSAAEEKARDEQEEERQTRAIVCEDCGKNEVEQEGALCDLCIAAAETEAD